ncbi:MAG TPA: methyltransferase domain-containing protein [Thermoanaerobaculia bacterium]|nr:methyltransferase domain-containing protein [Thermoanaerobaculia bacterium]
MTAWPDWSCPAHHTPLTRTGDALRCANGETYPIRESIPRFVESQAYTAGFGSQWQHFRLTQLDSKTGTTITEDRLRRCLGEELWTSLAGKHVLECGCGAGRFTEILVREGAYVTSVDMSEAVVVNHENVRSERHRVAQADLMKLPFAPRQFDVVMCLGVLQHTPDTRVALQRLYDHVRPGGWLVVDHYRRTWKRFTTLAPLFRAWMKRLSPKAALRWNERIVKFFFPLHVRARGRVSKLLLGRITPVMYYGDVYTDLTPEQHYQWSLLDTHDSLTDWYKRLLTKPEFQRMLEELGGTGVWCEHGGNGIEGRIRRPEERG